MTELNYIRKHHERRRLVREHVTTYHMIRSNLRFSLDALISFHAKDHARRKMDHDRNDWSAKERK